AERVSEMDIYEFESWVSCLDPEQVTCESQEGTHASYNRKTGQCEEQKGTECGGGENHFETLLKCNESCNDAPKPPCSLEVDYGVGRANIPRWYYDTNNATCEMFTYGGITGNKNNFESEEECKETCKGFSLLKKVNVTIN
nr:Chain A, Ixolaris [Ixodes scapularis]